MMTRYGLMLATTLCALAVSPALASAQGDSSSSSPGGTPAALSAGTFGLTLGVLGGNPHAAGTAGFYYFFTDQLNFGGSVGLRVENGDDDINGLGAAPGAGDWGVLLAPTLRYYFPRGHAVTPYFYGKVNIAFADRGPNDEHLSVEPGFGAEWFPYDYFSVGGHVGLNVNLVDNFGLGLLTSAMMVNFYF